MYHPLACVNGEPLRMVHYQVVHHLFSRARVSTGFDKVQHVLETKTIDRGANAGTLRTGEGPRYVRRVVMRGE